MTVKRPFLYLTALTLIACLIFMSLPARAQESREAKLEKIAEITRLKGQVLARSKMV